MPCPKPMVPRNAVPTDFGDQVRSAREARGWSKARLAARIGVARKTIIRLERGETTASLQTIQALMRYEVLGGKLPLIKGLDPASSDTLTRGQRALAARRASGQSLATVAAHAGSSIASLSAFERDLLVPIALVGPGSDPGSASDAYARALRFTDAADMEAYLRSDDPGPWLARIARISGRPLPPAARLPTRRILPVDDVRPMLD